MEQLTIYLPEGLVALIEAEALLNHRSRTKQIQFMLEKFFMLQTGKGNHQVDPNKLHRP